MPKIVDHNRRREEIAMLTCDVIRSVGIDNASIRGIAQWGGLSVRLLTHYFKNKDDLVAFTFRWLTDRSFTDLDRLLAAHPPGLARLEAAFEATVRGPNETTPLAIAIWTSVWDRATRNAAFAQEHRAYYARWRSYIGTFLSDAIALHEVPSSLDVTEATDLLVAAIDGLWISSAIEPKRFAGARRLTVLRRLIEVVTQRCVEKPPSRTARLAAAATRRRAPKPRSP